MVVFMSLCLVLMPCTSPPDILQTINSPPSLLASCHFCRLYLIRFSAVYVLTRITIFVYVRE